MGDQLELTLGAQPANQEQMDKLRALFPGAFVEGQLDPERLLAQIGHATAEDDRYRFGWAGRAGAIQALREPARGALHPMVEESEGFDDAHHVVIEGDNLEVLKLLQPAYAGQVKVITIDPPYNTGHDFVYPDNFSDSLGAYLRQTGQVDDAGKRLTSATEVDGRHHSRWLTMMYPRLVLARNLLTHDGAIFVAIDDHEAHHLRMLMNEIFGEENFVANITWQKRYTRSNNTDRFTSVVDRILLFQRSDAFAANLQPRTERDIVDFKNPDDDPRGPWKPTSFLNQVPPERRPNLAYPITNPNTGDVTHPDRKAWRTNQAGFDRLSSEGRLWWGKDGTRPIPQVKTYLSEVRKGLTPINFWSHQYAGHTDLAHTELKELFGRKVFDTPKPSLLIRRILEHATGPKDLVLDFFAGSGSTGQAVLELNRDDGGRRRCLLVQLPEPLEEGNYDTIAAITRDRVRRVAQRLRGTADLPNGQLGFRAFRLAPSALPSWPPGPCSDAAALAAQLEAQVSGPSTEVPSGDLVFEILARAGVRLDRPVEVVEVQGAQGFDVDAGVLLLCLAAELTPDAVQGMFERRPQRLILRESAFLGDDAFRLDCVRWAEAASVELRTV
jgi:adenine-specific DNA-methyltransferase